MYRATICFLALTFTPALAAAQTCTADARAVVREIYRHMLERQADARASYWVQQLQSGRTVRDVVREVAKSDEHIDRFWTQESGEETPFVRATETFYRHIVGTAPNAANARTLATQARRRGIDVTVDQLVDSAEFDQRNGDWGVPGSGGMRYCGANSQTDNWEAEPQAPGRGRGRGNQARREQRFENLDVNGNGRIEPREWDGTVAAFNRLDANNDNFLTRAEMVAGGANQAPVGTSGPAQPQSQSREIRVESRARWTDSGIDIRAGEMISFDARGTVRLGPTQGEVAGVDGTLSRRRDNGAPMGNQPEGALIARIGNSPVFFVGDLNAVRAPAAGRLYLGVNDGDLANNSGDFQVIVTLER